MAEVTEGTGEMMVVVECSLAPAGLFLSLGFLTQLVTNGLLWHEELRP
jgi:hypothetical protein